MSDEKHVEDEVKAEMTDTGVNEAEAQDVTETSEPMEEKSKVAGLMNPVVFLLFMIFAMIVILVVSNLKRSNPSRNNGNQADDPAVAALKADVKAGQMELNRQRMAMGLPPLEGGSEPIGDIADRLKNDADTITALAGRFQQMLGDKDAELTSKNTEILRLEKLRQDLSVEYSRLNTELQRALVSGSEATQLRKLLADSQASLDAFSEEISRNREKIAELSGGVSGDKYADLERRYQETLRSKNFFENRVKELEAELGRMNLFAKSENELLPAAVELYRRLKALEGLNDSDNNTEYSKIGVELGANVLHTLKFETGSSELSVEEMQQLDHIAADDVPDGDLTLIVGYASTTGDAAANQKLSSDRATGAAQYFDGRKRPNQRVQAVYLGQTMRFSGSVPERNQICEIWRIRQK